VNKRLKTFFVWGVLLAVLIFFVQRSQRKGPTIKIKYDDFLAMVERKTIKHVRSHNNELFITPRHLNITYLTLGVMNDELQEKLTEHGIRISWGDGDDGLGSMLYWIVMLAVLFIALLYFLRKMGAGGANIIELRKSRARLMSESSKVKFGDVGGCEDAKEQLSDVVDFLQNPKRWTSAGVRLPRGVLLEGPPGCGKTLLARAVAGETAAKFYTVAASEFVEMFVGVGAARVRDMFENARKSAPAVIFIDELDAVGRRRGSGIGAGHDEREQTLNQLLVCLDGFESNDRVVVIAATNRPDILDSALLRPGRIDRRIKIPEPNRAGRLQILTIHIQNKPIDDDVSMATLADCTEDFNGAALESLTNEAAMLAVRRCRHSNEDDVTVCMEDFLNALKPSAEEKRFFNKVDAVLVESTTQLAEPTGRAIVRLLMQNDETIEGEVVWADASFIKVRNQNDGSESIVQKYQITRIEALEGTESADRNDIMPDQWGQQMPDLA